MLLNAEVATKHYRAAMDIAMSITPRPLEAVWYRRLRKRMAEIQAKVRPPPGACVRPPDAVCAAAVCIVPLFELPCLRRAQMSTRVRYQRDHRCRTRRTADWNAQSGLQLLWAPFKHL